MKRFLSAFCIFLVIFSAIIAYVQLGPIRTVLGIQKSFRIGDIASLNNFIDFENIRESLKLQIRSYINQKNLIELENPLLRSLYSSFSYGIIDGVVEEYIQPKEIQHLFDFTKRSIDKALLEENNGELQAINYSEQNWLALAREYQAVCDFKFKSWSKFEIYFKESKTEPMSLGLFAGTQISFQRDGINWKVNDIIFSESFFESKLR